MAAILAASTVRGGVGLSLVLRIVYYPSDSLKPDSADQKKRTFLFG